MFFDVDRSFNGAFTPSDRGVDGDDNVTRRRERTEGGEAVDDPDGGASGPRRRTLHRVHRALSDCCHPHRGKPDATLPVDMKTLRMLGRTKRLLGLNALLAVLSVCFSIYIVWQLAAPLGPVASTQSVSASVAIAQDTPTPPAQAVYAVIGSRNLFSPTRTDTQKVEATVSTTTGLRLNLFGVVLAGDRSIAYLEEPVSKRVYAYRLGDSVAGGTIRAIEATHVVLEQRNQRVDVQLHDPSRPKPSLPVAVAMTDSGDSVARPAATDSRSDTVASAMMPTQPSATQPMTRPSASRFGIVAPALPRRR